MSTFAPLGPPTPKKPKAKGLQFMDGLFAYISCEDAVTTNTEIFAWVESENDYSPLESGTYTLLSGAEIVVVDGIIQ
jgi:hypothetical protein